MTQDQIDTLVSGLMNGDPEKVIDQKDFTICICKYCEKFTRIKVEGGDRQIKLLTHSECRKNRTGHFYMSKDYLRKMKG